MEWIPDPTLPLDTWGEQPQPWGEVRDPHLVTRWAQDREQLRQALSQKWIDFTLTHTVTLGTGGSPSAGGRYVEDTHGNVDLQFRIVLGTTGETMPTDPQITLPIPGAFIQAGFPLDGQIVCTDTGGGLTYPAVALAVSSTVVTIYCLGEDVGAGAAFVSLDNISGTTPFTWADNDILMGHLRYRRLF